MNNYLEFDRTEPEVGQAMYRVQRIDCSWSEWRSIDEKPREKHILSIQISEFTTSEQWAEFSSKYLKP